MKFSKTRALGAALLLGVGSIALQPALAKKSDAPKAANYSKAIQENIPVAQKALDGGNLDQARTAIAAAEAGIQNEDDRYAVGGTKLNLGIKLNDPAMQSAGIEMMIQSGKAPPAQATQLLKAQTNFAIQAKNYAKAEASAAQLVQIAPNDGDSLILLAQLKDMQKKPVEALPLIERGIAAKRAAGQTVSQDFYQRGLAIAYSTRDVNNVVKYGTLLLQAYPTPSNWRDTLSLYSELAKPDGQAQLDIYRLQRVAKALNGERDFAEYANSAFDKGLPGETVAVIDEGKASGMVTGTSRVLTETRGLAQPKIAADKASLAASATRARAGANGKPAANTADAYLGYGNYAEAAALYRLALQKGGVDADTVNTRLGIALARSGQKAEAQAAFNAVTGPTRKTIAQFWLLWLGAQA